MAASLVAYTGAHPEEAVQLAQAVRTVLVHFAQILADPIASCLLDQAQQLVPVAPSLVAHIDFVLAPARLVVRAIPAVHKDFAQPDYIDLDLLEGTDLAHLVAPREAARQAEHRDFDQQEEFLAANKDFAQVLARAAYPKLACQD